MSRKCMALGSCCLSDSMILAPNMFHTEFIRLELVAYALVVFEPIRYPLNIT